MLSKRSEIRENLHLRMDALGNPVKRIKDFYMRIRNKKSRAIGFEQNF